MTKKSGHDSAKLFRDAEIEDVRAFHRKFGVPLAETPRTLDRAAALRRVQSMALELQEFAEACGLRFRFETEVLVQRADDLAAQADALVDLGYFVKGTAAMMGLGAAWTDLWGDVHGCNMAKVRGTRAAGDREDGFDVVKPPGWVGPCTEEILEANGWKKGGGR